MKRIKLLRMLKDWSQQELADRAGLTQLTINKIETGKVRAMPKTIKALCDALNYTDGYDLFEDLDEEAVVLSIDDFWEAVDAEVTAALSAYKKVVELEEKSYAMETQGKQTVAGSKAGRINGNRYKRFASNNKNRKAKKNYSR